MPPIPCSAIWVTARLLIWVQRVEPPIRALDRRRLCRFRSDGWVDLIVGNFDSSYNLYRNISGKRARITDDAEIGRQWAVNRTQGRALP